MVHTRHKRDVGDSPPPIFLTLVDRKSRRGRSNVGNFDGHESDHSENSPRNDHSVFEEKIVESRLRPRTGPSRSYNYVFADSSDDEITSRRHSQMLDEEEYGAPRRRTHQRRIHSSDEEDMKERSDWGRMKKSEVQKAKMQRKKAKCDLDEEGDDEHDENGEHHEEHDDVDFDEYEDFNNSAVRRSSRLRRKPYRFRGSASRQEKDEADENGDTGKKRHYGDQDNSGEEFEDMYSRVKRPRTKRNEGTPEENSASASEGSQDEKNESGDETEQRRSYSLREHKPRTQLYIAPAIESKKRTKNTIFHADSPPRSRVNKKATYSPAQRKPGVRKREAFHGSGSSTSSDSESDSGTETSDEQRFNRRKAKSMVKARARICPLNFTPDMIGSSHVMKDRVRTGASLADVDPMEIDKSVTFDSVGGLQEHIMKLKEMVVFPLLYPEFYERFKVAPSRGVLFYGPPGTGKTLVARALANECSRGTQKVAFFMRKGADCLSKWVGEAERQLRLLFDKAYEMRPSIIFFDEIDGLAPVRSSRQDQIHSSIVSTMLALMDGIDARGEIVVIGATNRIDSIDPALRRPGRFDREFHFPLPSLMDRKKILKIHTKEWSPALRDDFLLELAEKCAGYCGADLKCLVTEATQNALRRRYPQIYTTSDKLQLDISSITLNASDFARAITNIVPAAQRAVPNPASALEVSVRPLLIAALTRLEKALASRFPCSKLNGRTGNSSNSVDSMGLMMDLPADEDENAPSIFMPASRGNKAFIPQTSGSVSYLKFAVGTSNLPAVFRPRMMVSGAAGQGQTVHLAPAALHLMEHLPVHALNSATLFAASAKMPEEACANVFHEAKRTAPSIIFIPYINELWGVISDCMRVTFLTMVRSVSPTTPILLLATSEVPYMELDDQLRSLFSMCGGEVVDVGYPTKEERHKFFHDLIMCQAVQAPPTHKQAESLASVGLSPFFPKQVKKKKRRGRKPGKSNNATTRKTRQSRQGDDHIPNPRSKQTKTGCTDSSKKAALNDVHGSGGEGCVGKKMTPIANLKGWTDSMTSVTVKFDSSIHEAGPSSKADKSNTACPRRNLSKETELSPSQLTIETGACSIRVSGMSVSMTSTQREQRQAIPRQTRRSGTRYAFRRKCKDNLNKNYSASSFLASPLPKDTKRYPSRRSPYNKKYGSAEEYDVFYNWQQFDVLPSLHQLRARRVLEPLVKAPPPEPRKLSEKELKQLYDQEEITLRELRIFLRDIAKRLGTDPRFKLFTKPVDEEEVPDYYDIIKKPMDLSKVVSKLDAHQYNTASDFLADIILICKNALEYNPDRGPYDRGIRHRACALKDTAESMLTNELDPDFDRLCQEINKSRKIRGVDSSQSVPDFYHTRPLAKPSNGTADTSETAAPIPSPPTVPEGCRYSRRVRGLDADRQASMRAVKKNVHLEESLVRNDVDESMVNGELLSEKDKATHDNKDDLEEWNKKAENQNNSSHVSDKHTHFAKQRDCLCPSSSGKKSISIYSGKSSKGIRDSRQSASKKASIRKKCPWLATRRRRRHHHSTPSHHRELLSSPGEIEVVTDEESSCNTPPKNEEGWDRQGLDRKDDHSNLSAANTTIVNVPNPARTRSSTDNIPESQNHEEASREKDKQKGSSSLQEKVSTVIRPLRLGAARSLDLDLIAVAPMGPDSGVGSESNGDSRDSLDQNNSNGDNITENHDHTDDTSTPSTSAAGLSMRSTRSRTQNPLQMSALAALERENGQVVVDKAQLSSLLVKTVAKTEGFTVEKLQHLYSVLSCIIYNHRYQLDKTQLLQEMGAAVEMACRETGHSH